MISMVKSSEEMIWNIGSNKERAAVAALFEL